MRCDTETAGKTKHVITIDRHTLLSDMPIAGGGEDAGPGAHALFDASLAACKGLTAMVYAKAKNLPLEKVHVELERDDTQEKQGTYVLKLKIGFEGPLSPEQKSKLLDILGRCPVHKLMTTATIDIQTTAA